MAKKDAILQPNMIETFKEFKDTKNIDRTLWLVCWKKVSVMSLRRSSVVTRTLT